MEDSRPRGSRPVECAGCFSGDIFWACRMGEVCVGGGCSLEGAVASHTINDAVEMRDGLNMQSIR
jgi:hypothetical protein